MNVRYKCLIVDDEPLAIRLIEKHIRSIPELQCMATCNNAMEANTILRNTHIDLIFLDIQMPVLNGIEFVKTLHTRPHVIFTTAYREYAIESYELDVVDYLLKPIGFPRFYKAVQKFLKLKHHNVLNISSLENESDHFFVNVNRKMVKVYYKEILYVESLKDYLKIHIDKGQVVTKAKISTFIEKLPNQFLRIHRSFIVNKNRVTAFTAHDVEIDKIELPIGVSYKSSISKILG